MQIRFDVINSKIASHRLAVDVIVMRLTVINEMIYPGYYLISVYLFLFSVLMSFRKIKQKPY